MAVLKVRPWAITWTVAPDFCRNGCVKSQTLGHHLDGSPRFLFPGGMKDDVDLDLSQTALRETFEEIGLSTENVNIWGNLPKIPSKKDGKIEVTPYLGFCGDMDTSKLVLDDSEVDTVFTRTLTSLCDPVNVGSTQFSNGYTLPVFLGGEFRIWGMTAILLHQALTILAPGMYNYKLRHVRPLHTKPS
ncbi:mitochondrial coenzyme A diphosphatase NUDT8-like [Ylistrum balloti]|uniref:mitochondrial coenzyme A diphosphatase NUDT8-like n=1 Tax=Ylistrum balloti TaxID=509963 RepID=UPI002905C044|nr:mitochondrial coenzyme A diphosphatase NUDT8-like [Ylistrum balloti]